MGEGYKYKKSKRGIDTNINIQNKKSKKSKKGE